MPRIPYLPIDHATPPELVAAIRKRRGGELVNLDRLLLHSPPLAAGWNEMLGRVRTALSLPGRLREIAMCAVATLNHAEYEFHHHAPVLLQEGGTQAQVDALRDPLTATGNAALFDDAERATIQLTIEMTRNVQVAPATFESVRKVLPNEQQVVELVAVIAAYNMVSRFLVAFDVQPE